MKVKSKAQIEANYKSGATVAGARYKTGVQTADWKEAAKDGQALYEAKMSDPEVLARRNKGIEKVSDAEWRKAAEEKGAPVIASRMTAAAPKQSAGFEPYRQVLESTTLPPRTTDGMENLINRTGTIVKAMEAKKREIG